MSHDRQARLAEVGAAGQARIAAASVVVDGEGALYAALYLQRAGVLRLAIAQRAGRAFPHEGEFQHPASRELAAGAWRALWELRRALGVAAGDV